MPKYFKAVDFVGGSGLGRTDIFVGKLPVGKEPGGWVEVDGELMIKPQVWNGDHGVHVATRKWIVRFLCDRLFEAEVSGQTHREGRFLVARKVRLVREIPNWNARTARLFAAACARRVLPVFEAAIPDDKRVRAAIETAIRFANGECDETDLEEAKAAAFAAYEAIEHSPRATSAALSAVMCCDNDQPYGSIAREAAQNAVAAMRTRKRRKELRWQSQKLFSMFRTEAGGGPAASSASGSLSSGDPSSI